MIKWTLEDAMRVPTPVALEFVFRMKPGLSDSQRTDQLRMEGERTGFRAPFPTLLPPPTQDTAAGPKGVLEQRRKLWSSRTPLIL